MNIMEYNELKRQGLVEKIKNCNGDYFIFFIDVDDVIYNTEPVMQKVLEDIDYRATTKYRVKKAQDNSEDSKEEGNLSYKILDAILEETLYEEYDERKDAWIRRTYRAIDYDKEVYLDKHLFDNAIEYIRNIIKNKGDNVFVVACSHRNPVREGETKTQRLYEKLPELDLVITLPYHVQVGFDEVNSKALYVKKVLSLETLENCLLIDNAKKNCRDWRRNGGIDINFLPYGYKEEHTLADHISKLATLDPHGIQFALSYIDYARKHPEYVNEVDVPMKVKKL